MNECRCWACTIWQHEPHRRDYDDRIAVYEAMVEHIETGAHFSISSLGDQFRHLIGPTAYSIARNVVHDLYRHELITCLKHDKGIRCLRWIRRKDR